MKMRQNDNSFNDPSSPQAQKDPGRMLYRGLLVLDLFYLALDLVENLLFWAVFMGGCVALMMKMNHKLRGTIW